MEEEVDHRGDELPPLTKRSRNINLERILKLHKPDFSDAHLTTTGFWPIIRTMMGYGHDHVMSRTWYHYHGEDPNNGPGALAVAWHTAGLIDPLLIVLKINKPFVFAGRQDILTGPIIGWWGRRMGVQPLLRQAERLRGFVDDETATRVNSASMLTVASKLAHGQASILLPEGHSHSEWYIHRLRTGPVRSALNAAALAREIGNDVPVILPVGLTFRDPHAWFSDALVEFGEPIQLPELPDKNHGAKLLAGDWVEPDKETTIAVRDEMRDRLGYLTPDAPDIDTWRAWLLLGHITAKLDGKRLTTWKQEVLHGRAFRDQMRGTSNKVWQGPEGCGEEDLASTSKLSERARKAANTLHDMGLDARASHPDSAKINWKNIALALVLMPLVAVALPFIIVGNGLQALVGVTIAKFNSEAVDKKTTFHMMPMMLGTVLFRPLIHVGTVLILLRMGYFSEYSAYAMVPILTPILWLITDASAFLCRCFLRISGGIKRNSRTYFASRSKGWVSLRAEFDELSKMLGALK
ncbi:MAG: hypothetical protein HOE69_07025 [Euryarchaeota archaeon]|jgi:1-acyl-sn-glycerol-3-phosphate acyltransferase|nr:hypothetical protein [Euryarchaeota archaeon]